MDGTAITDQYFLSTEVIKDYFAECLKNIDRNVDLVVLINRKGYWDYKIFFPSLELNKENQRIVISDRLLEKYPIEELKKLLSGKRVIVYDDSLTNGSNLFYYYLLCKAYGAKKVLPVVYALNASFPSSRSIKLMEREAGRIDPNVRGDVSVQNLIDEFVDNLICKVILGNADIDRMSIWQTMLFQKNLSPLVMDLPMLNHRKNTKDKKISLNRVQFEKLCNYKDAEWCFISNEMNGWGESVKACYFRFDCGWVSGKVSNLIHDFVVKCKFNLQDEIVDVVFTPFAIVKSISFEKAFQLFNMLYEDTVYGDNILKWFPNREYSASVMERDHNICRALFRAIIFRLSDYIGRNFQKYVRRLLEVELEYDWDIMEDNFDPTFIETEKMFYAQYDEEKLQHLIFQCCQDEPVLPLHKSVCLAKKKVQGTQGRINNYVRGRTSAKKRDMKISLGERIYTFETIESEICDRFFFNSEYEKKERITNVCLLLLETNSFSNMIFPDNHDHIIYRSFRYGENSEIFLNENLWLFYGYLYAYYNEYGSKSLKEHYSEFMDRVKENMIQQKYFGTWMSEDDFSFLRDYFGKMEREELVEEIQRREYLLDCTIKGKEDVIKKDILNKAAEAVKLWGEV